MGPSSTTIARVGLATVLMCVMVTATQTFDLGELDDASELDLALPSFPTPPDHDLKLLHMEHEASDMRFRAVSEGEDEDEAEDADADEQQSEDEESESDESESEDEVEGEAEDEAEVETEEEEPQFVETSQQQRLMRAGRYDTRGMFPGPPPVRGPIRRETGPAAYARAMIKPEQMTESVFQPIHNSQRMFGRAGAPVASLNAGANNYAMARARVYPNYYYGNNLIPTPVNAQFYPTPNGIPPRPFQPPPQPQPQPMAPPAPTPAPAPAAAPIAPSFAELNAGINQMTRTYSSWPSSIAPPAAYYLPPDVVV